ncbi:hypothetical protein [Fluviicola sp.]|jgi:hypothetical protein|uniref:hypothetical protein n=1 Tax=Fluviicola sp. TaxID=1917219 RepID=UPI00281E013B|nr:hypothetical protein [Fluviicola sp.]MDR0802492.1 hypothetical protein [Fluviicola sp.]
MKKSILYILMMGIQGMALSQESSLSVHNSCVKAAKVCQAKQITTVATPHQAECEEAIQSQFFKFDLTTSGTIFLDTYEHTGTYTLYGPLSALGISSCQQISLGQVAQADGNLSGAFSIPHGEGYYVLRVNPANCISSGGNYKVNIYVSSRESTCDEQTACKDCIGSFSPDPGAYLVSAWVKGETEHPGLSYENPEITVSFVGAPDSFHFLPSGLIIDDWQRIDGVVTVPSGATGIRIGLYCKSGTCLFDDIRFIPMDGSMISYVYDPVSLRLVAQLDERNYATLYEYDEQGKLIRTKKETERGIMTITESRDNIYNK